MKYIIRAFIFVIAYLLIVFFIKLFFAHYAWGNQDVYSKLHDLNLSEYNTLFVGSSKVYRNINPIVFDSITGEGHKSFNMGMSGVYYFESVYLLKNALKKNSSIENVFLLNQVPKIIAEKNLNSTKTQYYFTLGSLIESVKYFSYHNVEQSYLRLKQLLKNIFGVRLFSSLHSEPSEDYAKFSDLNGYIPLEDELGSSKNIEKRKLRFERKIEEKGWEKIRVKGDKNINPEAFCENLNDLDEFLTKRDIKLYLIVIPDYEYPKCSLDHARLIDLNTFRKYRYSSLRFDSGHLNKEGSILFTEKLAKIYLNILKE